jgi:hypothetical protein
MPEIELAAATLHADEDPNPTPAGISELIDIFIPELELNFFRIFCATYTTGLKIELMFCIGSSLEVTIVPRLDTISILFEFVS